MLYIMCVQTLAAVWIELALEVETVGEAPSHSLDYDVVYHVIGIRYTVSDIIKAPNPLLIRSIPPVTVFFGTSIFAARCNVLRPFN